VSTLAWIVVVWAAAAVAFLLGYVVRVGLEREQARYGGMLDFTRKQSGA
jgi:uncharacterized protein (DUF849 family)